MSLGDGRTRTRYGLIWILLGFLALALVPASGTAAPAEPGRRDRSAAADSDGDGIADDFDPDDDNDGVADDQEGAEPGPDILAPDKDTDGDGISNVLDPDDNNNAVTDENDPSSFPPSNGGGSSEPGSGGPSTSPPPADPRTDTRGGTGVSSQSDLLISALPVTGAGSAGQHLPEQLTAVVLALLSGAAAAIVRSPRTGIQAFRGAASA